MPPASRLRLIGLHVVLIVSAIQGLTPAAQTLASPWALERLQDVASSGRSDPGQDGPVTPIAGPDEPVLESLLPGERIAGVMLARRMSESDAPLFVTPGVVLEVFGARISPLHGVQPRPARSASVSISLLCRLIC